jgi:molecular chaperone GrpE
MTKTDARTPAPAEREDNDGARQDETAGSAPSSARERLAEEAEALCADLERFFRRGFGEIPKASDMGELRAHQASVRELVNRGGGLNEGSPEKVQAIEAERDKFKDAAARSRADFLNYQGRAAKDLERAEELSLRRYVSELLPILDSLDMARHDAAGNPDPERLKEALEMIGTSLDQVLAVRGLERIAAAGKPFDPAIHEAVAKRPADPAKGEKPSTVLEELRPGYLWKGLILRPAQVLVAEK